MAQDSLMENSTYDDFYHELPDNMFIPSPPLHPSFYLFLSDTVSKKQCNVCNVFYKEDHQLINEEGTVNTIAVILAFLLISGVLLLYLRRSKIIAGTRHFRTKQSPNIDYPMDESISTNIKQANHDKNFTLPIINDQIPHKKTAIPSKCWAQPGSIIGRTIRRIPNEYEVPSSRTNSTGTSSAVYADMNIENHQRFFSPYNLHTYVEV